MNKKYFRSLFLLFSLTGFLAAGCSHPKSTPSDDRFGISLENATHLEKVATYGEGLAQEISLSPDGRWMAIRSTTGLHLYDTQTWQELKLKDLSQEISESAFSPNGDLLALAVPDTNEIQLWKLPEGELVHSIAMPGGYYSTLLDLKFTPSGDKLISTSFQVINVWRVSDGGLVQSFQSSEGGSFKNTSISSDGTLLAAVLVGNAVNGVMAWELEDQESVTEYSVDEGNRFDDGQFSPNGEQYAALARDERKLFVWQSLRDPRPLEIQSPSDVVNFVWLSSMNGNMLVTGDTNGDVMLWESATGELLKTLRPPHQEYVNLLQVDVIGSRLAVAYGNGSIGLWSLPDDSLEWMMEPLAGEVPMQIAIHADGTRLFSVLPNGRVRIRDMQNGQEIGTFEKLTTGKVLDLAFSPGGEWIAAGLENGFVSLWQSDAGESSKILIDQGARVDSVAFAPDTRRLAVGVGGYIRKFSYDDTVRVWDWANDNMLQQFAGEQKEVQGCSVFRNQVAFSPDGSVLASISHDFSVSLWDTKAQELGKKLEGHTQPILDVAISANGTILASTSLDGTIRLWQISDGMERRVILGDPVGMLAVAISPDERFIAGASVTGVISVWDVASGHLLRTLEGDMNNNGMLTFSPDGSLIAAGKGENLQLWSSETGELIATLPGEGGGIVSVAFSNDGELLAYGLMLD